MLFVVVFPPSVQMAVNWSNRFRIEASLAWARLPLQLPIIWWALRVRRHSVAPQPA